LSWPRGKPFSLITGGTGTGKPLRWCESALQVAQLELRIALAALTGALQLRSACSRKLSAEFAQAGDRLCMQTENQQPLTGSVVRIRAITAKNLPPFDLT
jgi:hypothetical protein